MNERISPVPMSQPIVGLALDLSRDADKAIREEAALRRMRPSELARRILETVAKDDLFAAVLDE